MKSLKQSLLIAAAGLALIGCSSNPTNEPSVDEINTAVDRKMKAIDDDPSMTAEQKAELKKHIAGRAQTQNSNGR